MNYVRKDAKLPFISSVRLAVRQTLKIIAADNRIESLGKVNSIARNNEDHTVRDVEGKCGVSILPVAATDRVAGSERK